MVTLDQKSFLRPETGQNTFWRYVSTFAVSLSFFLIVGSVLAGILFVIYFILKGDLEMSMDEINPMFLFIITNLPYFFGLLGIFIGVKFILKRNLKTLITPYEKVDWRKIIKAYVLYFGLLVITFGVSDLIQPELLQISAFNWKNFVYLLILVILLTPIQTTVEELMFRGLVLQAVGKYIKHPLVVASIGGLVFGLIHFGNPEMAKGSVIVGITYIILGLSLSWITVHTNTSELAIGIHAANNMFLTLFISDKGSVFGELPSLFILKQRGTSLFDLIQTIIVFILFYFIAKKMNLLNKNHQESI